jgi:hypothetical protein
MEADLKVQNGIPLGEIPTPEGIAKILQLPLNRFYTNGFLLGNTNTDVFIITQINGVPTTILNMSFETAKLLNEGLIKTITGIETQTGQEVKYLNIPVKK